MKVLRGNQHKGWRLALQETTNNVSSEIKGCVRNLGEVKNQVLLSWSREAKAGEKENGYRLSQRSLANPVSIVFFCDIKSLMNGNDSLCTKIWS